ncbi:MAG: formylglycine-generating enzyme family protein [Richelia sp. CSU_2_1]|nr:formylglycine-generating enzyme family protein [Richelia sp. CSU_2_1]
MSENPNEPREYDAVLGGQNSIPVNAAVLGGIPGVKSRLASPIVEVRIAALSEALKYGEAGLDLIIQALQDESMQVKFAAYSLLKDRDEFKIKQQLRDYRHTFEFDVITVDSHGRENSRTKSFARFFPEDLGNGTILEMVYISGGTFMMGAPQRESKNNNEEPPHQVSVKPFFMGKYPITQAQWQAVANLPKIHYDLESNLSYFKGENRPVECVSWYDAVEFCARLSQKTGKTYRLPSETEWEYACRAGTTTPFHFGENITTDLANYEGNYIYGAGLKGIYRKETTPVGSFGVANAFGLYDMHGNVREWCADPFHDGYQGAPGDGTVWDKNGIRIIITTLLIY